MVSVCCTYGRLPLNYIDHIYIYKAGGGGGGVWPPRQQTVHEVKRFIWKKLFLLVWMARGQHLPHSAQPIIWHLVLLDRDLCGNSMFQQRLLICVMPVVCKGKRLFPYDHRWALGWGMYVMRRERMGDVSQLYGEDLMWGFFFLEQKKKSCRWGKCHFWGIVYTNTHLQSRVFASVASREVLW